MHINTEIDIHNIYLERERESKTMVQASPGCTTVNLRPCGLYQCRLLYVLPDRSEEYCQCIYLKMPCYQ